MGITSQRAASDIKRVVSDALREVSDPRVSGCLITITECSVSPDVAYCTLYISVLGEYNEKELKTGLYSAVPFLRRVIAKNVRLRVVPELRFSFDKSGEYGDKIEGLINKLHEGDSI
ncbi:MAG: 30S ribosome-binding factor RbfA [Oscillospiraceae bacterium]|jgi:ribosome-binding factor A|nr:30S ribosome-binding factor RbfA [Oscillospiraceae bacterium]